MHKFYARIHPDVVDSVVDYRTASLTFKATPPDQPWLGWQQVTPEQASHLRRIQLNPANMTNSPRVFQVENEETYVSIVKEGRKTASKALDPVATAQINDLQARLEEVKGLPGQMAAKDAEIADLKASYAETQTQLAQILALLQAQRAGGPVAAPAAVVAPKADPSPEISPKATPVPAIVPPVPEEAKPNVPAAPRPGRKREEPKVEIVAPPPVKSDE